MFMVGFSEVMGSLEDHVYLIAANIVTADDLGAEDVMFV